MVLTLDQGVTAAQLQQIVTDCGLGDGKLVRL